MYGRRRETLRVNIELLTLQNIRHYHNCSEGAIDFHVKLN